MLIVNVQKVSSGLTDTFCFRANEIKVCYSRRRPLFVAVPILPERKGASWQLCYKMSRSSSSKIAARFLREKSGKLSVLGFDKVMLNFAAPRLSRPRQFCEDAQVLAQISDGNRERGRVFVFGKMALKIVELGNVAWQGSF